jgi:type VI secretion system secreted protein Hcp
MATEIFAKIGDIKGESLDSKHKDEIEVLSFAWGVSNPGPTSPGGGSGVGKPTFQDLTIVHGIDNATPALLLACATGRRINEATISHRKAGANQQDYLIVKLSEVTIISVGQTGAEDHPYAESVTLKYNKVDLHYRRQKPDGSLDAGQHFKYDLKTNQAG